MNRLTLDLRQLETFLAVLAHGSFHEAGGVSCATTVIASRDLDDSRPASATPPWPARPT